MCKLDGCGKDAGLPPIVVSETDRRAFLAGAMSLPLAAVLFHPDLARAQAAGLEPLEFDTEGGGKASGVLAMPAETPAPAVILIHEWWGLNDSIKTMAREFADRGYVAFAIDLYGGEVADTPEGARELMSSMDEGAARDKLASAVAFLKDHEATNGKVGTVGWCFGGGWSINTATAADVDATVVYYGRLPSDAAELESVDAPVLGHFGTEDDNINPEMVGAFERAMEAAGKSDLLEVHWYVADHAFANPSGARYDADDAALALARTMTFFEKNLVEG